MTQATKPTLRSPLHHWHVAHGARMEEIDGWRVPVSYAGEREPTVDGLALVDLSAFAKVSVRGPGVADLTGKLLGDALKPLGVASVPGERPVLVCRLSDDHLMLLGSAPRLELHVDDVDVCIPARDL